MPSPGVVRAGATAAPPLSGALRLVRGGLLGGLSLLLATTAHVLGGGTLPSTGVLLVSAVLLGLLAAVLTARRCRLSLLLSVLTVQQVLLHELFDLAGAARACSVAVPAHLAGSPHVHAGAHLAGAFAPACTSAAGMAMAVPGWTMWAAHLGATALTAWLLARGEAWLWRAVDRVAAAAGLGAGRAPHARLARAQVLARAVLAPCSGTWRPAGPRGPPALPAV